MEMKIGVLKEKVVKLEPEEKGYVECKCKELEERCRKAEARCLVLELEVGKSKREKEGLETIITALKFEKLGIENELRNLKRGNEEKVDLNEKKEEENRVLNLMIKINVLESEKQRAEKEVEKWKKRFNEMESMALKMDGLLRDDGQKKVINLEVEGSLQEQGTPKKDTPRELTKKTTPSTSSIAIPAPLSIIEIHDDDDEHDLAKIKTPCALDRTLVIESKSQSNGEWGCGETMDRCKENVPVISASKRKRPTKVVTSGEECDIDYNIPISELMKMSHLEVIPDRASSEVKDCSDSLSRTNKKRRLRGDEDEKPKELNGSDSLSRFIVNDDDKMKDVSRGFNTDRELRNSDSQEFNEIMSFILKIKNGQPKWKFEGEGQMLAAFSRDAVLCMKAVCALHRQQTKAEQVQKGTIVLNQRGLNQSDIFRVSTLAEFLTEGDPQSDVKKSAKELKKHDQEGVDMCRKLAIRYSKQLFEIYEKKQDPYFLP